MVLAEPGGRTDDGPLFAGPADPAGNYKERNDFHYPGALLSVSATIKGVSQPIAEANGSDGVRRQVVSHDRWFPTSIAWRKLRLILNIVDGHFPN